MSRDQHEIVLVPKWFGLEPSDAYAVISAVLSGSGGRATKDGTFRLDAAAVNHLRRQGITIRNRRTLSVAVDATTRNRDLLTEMRSHVHRHRATVIATQAHAQAREDLARRVLLGTPRPRRSAPGPRQADRASFDVSCWPEPS